MQQAFEGLVSALSAIVSTALTVLFFSTSLGVVREYCLDVAASQAQQRVVVDKHWTYILWPPLMFAGMDPPGRCVRNLPARQALDALGIWKLPSPEEQVRRHVAAQFGNGGDSGTQADYGQRDAGYMRAVNQIMAPFSKPPANPTDYKGGNEKLHAAIKQLSGLAPPPSFAKGQADLVGGLQQQARLGLRMARASAARDSVTLYKLEQHTIAAAQIIRRALSELIDTYNGCRASKFKTC